MFLFLSVWYVNQILVRPMFVIKSISVTFSIYWGNSLITSRYKINAVVSSLHFSKYSKLTVKRMLFVCLENSYRYFQCHLSNSLYHPLSDLFDLPIVGFCSF